MIVLDTDLLSGLRRSADAALRRWLAEREESYCISIYSVTEIQYGIALVRPRDPRFADDLSGWLDQVLAATQVLPFDVAAARLLGEMRAVPQLRRLEGDLVVAATAIVAGVPLATLNLPDFHLIARHFPALAVVDPHATR